MATRQVIEDIDLATFSYYLQRLRATVDSKPPANAESFVIKDNEEELKKRLKDLVIQGNKLLESPLLQPPNRSNHFTPEQKNALSAAYEAFTQFRNDIDNDDLKAKVGDALGKMFAIAWPDGGSEEPTVIEKTREVLRRSLRIAEKEKVDYDEERLAATFGLGDIKDLDLSDHDDIANPEEVDEEEFDKIFEKHDEESANASSNSTAVSAQQNDASGTASVDVQPMPEGEEQVS